MAWNGPKEFQPPTQTIIEEALEDYFSGNSPQFHTADNKTENYELNYRQLYEANITNFVLILHIIADSRMHFIK